MAKADTRRELWGGETTKAVANFPVSGEPIPVPVARWLGRIKAAAALVNGELGLLDEDKAQRIAAAGIRIANGELDDQFPIDVFQTGSGTSSNMNANEVIAALAGDDVHANDDVNMGQSSNDAFPTAVHLAALDELTNLLLPALGELAASLEAKAAEFADVVKAGRTHLMDAVPVTLGQEFGGYGAQIRVGGERVKNALPHVAQIPLGGTATGTGLNTHPEFAQRVRDRIKQDVGVEAAPPADPFEAQGNRDALVELSGALKVVAVSMTKIANDLIGNDMAITVAGTQGNFELNVRVPLIARNLLDSIKLLTSAATLLAEKCVDGIQANEEVCRQHGESTPAIATALNPYIC